MPMNQGAKKRVLILGGGFAGVYAALEFERMLKRETDIEVTLVNRENFFLFTPMLHEVAASDLDITDIVNPIRKLLRRVQFFNGVVESVDLKKKTVTVSHADGQHRHELPYDHLVLGLGCITNFFNLHGLAECALTMKSLGDAIELRNRLIRHLEEADFECAIGERKHLLTIVVAGGGFAGVETVAGVNDFLREALEFYPHLKESDLRLVLVHPGPLILPELGEQLGAYAQRKLAERKVEIRVNTRVLGIGPHGIELSDGTSVVADTLVWTAGTSPHPLLSSMPCQKERGRILVDEYMEALGFPGVWALGDCAAIPDKRTGQMYPPTAQHALREGRTLAQNIQAAIHNCKKSPFVFSTIGQLAAIGRRTGVARILGVNFSGFIAWWLWRTIYLSKLPRLEKKMRVMLNWTLDVLFSKDLVQFRTVRSQAIAGLEELEERPGRAPTEEVPVH